MRDIFALQHTSWKQLSRAFALYHRDGPRPARTNAFALLTSFLSHPYGPQLKRLPLITTAEPAKDAYMRLIIRLH
jgi:hypothetical protein